MSIKSFLEENHYIDFSSPVIKEKTKSLFFGVDDDITKAKIAYEFVRDEVPHAVAGTARRCGTATANTAV